MSEMAEIVAAVSSDDIATVGRLFRQYAESLDIDLAFQHFERELATLPGDYAAPRGALFLARLAGTPAGCIGVRPFAGSVGEVKRLYVLPAFRGRGLARSLVSAAVAAAGRLGYDALVLDTLASMREAIALYRSFGFEPTGPYYANPLPDALYFRKVLGHERRG